LPESFRGGCSFGAGKCRSLPSSLILLTGHILLKNHIATVSDNSRRFPLPRTSGEFRLICLFQYSDVVLEALLHLAGREQPIDAKRLVTLGAALAEALMQIDLSISERRPTLESVPYPAQIKRAVPCPASITYSDAASRGAS
jgi:hypothetical protein